jgi:hypothetical protein
MVVYSALKLAGGIFFPVASPLQIEGWRLLAG